MMLAELITLTTSDGLTHYGALYTPGERPAQSLGVVLVHGLTGSFVGPVEGALPPLLSAAGYPCLVANNRGHDTNGAATERFSDCLEDIQAAIDLIVARGCQRVALIGHSKGGVKVAYYMAQRGDPHVVALGLLSPAPNVHDIPRLFAHDHDDDQLIERVRMLVEQGHGDTMITTSSWPYLGSAAMLWDHHTTRDDEVLELLPRIHVPILALCGSQEVDWCLPVAVLKKRPPEGYTVQVIEGADHLYTDRKTELGRAVVDWLGSGVRG